MQSRAPESSSVPDPKASGGVYPSFTGLNGSHPAPRSRNGCAREGEGGGFSALPKKGFVWKRERIVASGGGGCVADGSGFRRGVRGTFRFLLTPRGLHRRFGRGAVEVLFPCCPGASPHSYVCSRRGTLALGDDAHKVPGAQQEEEEERQLV